VFEFLDRVGKVLQLRHLSSTNIIRTSPAEVFARVFGLACLIFAVVLVVEPGLAPGLDPDAVRTMDDMNM
jgi:hypothetical protein